MPTGRYWDSDWLAQNSQRNYPLLDGCSAKSQDAAFTIPSNFMLDLVFPISISSGLDPALIHIYQVSSYSAGYVVVLGYDSEPIAAFSVPAATHTWGKEYVVTGQGDFETSTGLVAIGDLGDINLQPSGVFLFNPADAIIQPRCIVPTLQHLQGVKISSGGVVSSLLTGIVTLQEGANVQFAVNNVTNTIKISAVGDSGFLTDCVCDSQRNAGTSIKRINGISPNADGDFILIPSYCMKVAAATNGLTIEETCSTPCCGCDELSVVKDALDGLRSQFATLSNYATRLDTLASNLNSVISVSLARFPNPEVG